MYKTASLLLGAALLSGCEDSRRVYGDYSFRNDSALGKTSFRNGQVQGETDFRPARGTDAGIDARPAAATLDSDRPVSSGTGVLPSDVARYDAPRGDVARPEAPRSDTLRSESDAVTARKDIVHKDNPGIITPGTADPERAAYASSRRFPTNMKASDDLRVTASIDPADDRLVIRNKSDQPLSNLNVWANGQYVSWVGVIAPNESVSLRRSDFSDKDGRAMTDWKGLNSVQLQAGDNLFNTTGIGGK